MDAELQRGKVIYPKSHSQEEMEPRCELSHAEAEAHGLCATSGGRVIVHPVQLFNKFFSWQEVLPKTNPNYLLNLNLHHSAVLSQEQKQFIIVCWVIILIFCE